ncbi:MAG: ABC transporter permease [Acidobacteria bacterium]|nr:ABC transporter permease [Acidobacteriota bacterium]MCA1636746.1 ABC transporter permease [Acidobacteriota bacterium]
MMKHFLSRFFNRLLIRRAIQSIILILLLIIINFFLIHLAPGDPVYYLAGQSGDEQYYELIRAKFGLDQPLPAQLWVYLSSVLRGDLGYSLSYQQPVSAVIFSRVPATLLLILSAITMASIGGVLLGVEAARRENSFYDRLFNTFALLGYSFPSFSIGHMLLLFFALYLGLFPAQGMMSANQDLSGISYWLDLLNHLVLPSLTLAIVQIAQIMRLTRAEMLNVLGENFITTARAKGVSERKVLYGHALRNALLPVVTIIGSDLGMLLSGAVLTETVFAYPGLGRLTLEVLAARDYPVLMGLFLLISIGVAVMNFLTDITYPLIDPRIKYSR